MADKLPFHISSFVRHRSYVSRDVNPQSWGHRFKYDVEHRYFLVCVSPSGQMMGWYHRLGHDRFSPHGDRSLFFLYFGSLSDLPVVNQLINQKSVISVDSLYSTVIYNYKMWSRGSTVGKVTRFREGRSGVQIYAAARNFLPKYSKWIWGPPRLLLNAAWG
jgi:hypothetical protein